VEPADA